MLIASQTFLPLPIIFTHISSACTCPNSTLPDSTRCSCALRACSPARRCHCATVRSSKPKAATIACRGQPCTKRVSTEGEHQRHHVHACVQTVERSAFGGCECVFADGALVTLFLLTMDSYVAFT